MSTLLTNVGNVITSLVSWLGSVASDLIKNPIFQIMLAVVLFKLLFNKLKNLNNKKDMNKWSSEDFKKDLENWIEEHPGAHEENGTWVQTISIEPIENDPGNELVDDDLEIPDLMDILDNDEYDEYKDYLNSLNGHNDI